MPDESCGACEFCGCHTFHHEACPNYERTKRSICRATWTKGREVDWWEWTYDEERQAYIMADSDNVMPRYYIMNMMARKQAEGWQLCRAVV